MSTPDARRRPARADVRRDLLDAAVRVFARRGIDAASLDEVAAEAGLTKGAIYSNFSGKADLVGTMVEEKLRLEYDAGLAAADVAGDLPTRARALGDGLSRTFAADRDWHLLFVELWQRAVRSDHPDDALLGHRRELRGAMVAAIEAAAAESGSELPLPADELATVLLALSNGLMTEHFLGDGQVAPDLFGRVLALLVRPEA